MATSLCPRATCLRSFTSSTKLTLRPNSTARVPLSCAAAPFTTSARPSKQLCLSTDSRSRATSQTSSITPGLASPGVRYASSSATSPPSQEPSSELLTWDRFFDLRRKRRYVNLLASAGTAGVAVAVGAPIMMQQDLDSWGAQISGLEPLVVLPMMTFMVAAGGWLCGPSLGSLGFKMWAGRKGWNTLIAEKEKSFYARIRRYRADPSSSSPQNPIPDYYGEKIASVKDYRRWLKDQRAFNLKKNKNML